MGDAERKDAADLPSPGEPAGSDEGASPDGASSLGKTLELNNGTRIPRLGLGVYQIPDGAATEHALAWAFEAGYRHVDTAKLYRNEASVGKAVRQSGLPREQIWVTTKLWVTDEIAARRAFDASLKRLGLEYVDLYLVHFPVPGLLRWTWRSMEAIARSGRARAIGVSNYSTRHLETVIAGADVPPSVNQVRCSPFDFDRSLYDSCRAKGIAFEAYSPLTRGKRIGDPRLGEIATRHGRTPAQVLIRWALQKDMVVIPKSADEGRIRENAAVWDFSLDAQDMLVLDALSA